jgi:LysR family nitrogen assimilation transcriptional regulator
LLEEELDVRLLHRNGHGVGLTEAGEILAERSKGLLKELGDIRDEVKHRAQRKGLAGKVSVGISPASSSFLAHPFLAHCREQYPAVSLRLLEGLGIMLEEWLRVGSVDLALLYGPRASKSIIATRLLIEDLYAVGACTPENQARTVFTPADLCDAPLILPHQPHVIRDLAQQAGIEPRHLTEVDAFGVMVELARSGAGFALLPISTVSRDIAAGRVVAIPVERPSISWTVSICHSSVRPLSPAAAAIRELMRREIDELVKTGHWPARLAQTDDPANA